MPNKKTIEQRFQSKNLQEHILLRPDSYIGSIEPIREELWIYNDESDMMEKKDIKITKGLYKIFDEILVNAFDNVTNDKTCDILRVNIDQENNCLSVWNNGEGIPVEMHKEEKIYVPELIFAKLLTGSNFDDEEERITGGKNGYGAKLANIYSTEFKVETVCFNNETKVGKKFIQVHSENMTKSTKPKVTTLKSKNPKTYTFISFKPDLPRFGMTELTVDTAALFKKRVHDIAACCGSKVKVYLNDKLIKANTFKKYINMYYDAGKVIYEEVSDRWQIAMVYIPDDGFEQISYVNGISTMNGGKHVDYIMDNIVKRLNKSMEKKLCGIKIRSSQVKEHIKVFVNARIVNPNFTSQTKEELKTPISKFGSKCQLNEKFIKALCKTGIQNQVINLAKARQELSLKKSDGKKSAKVSGLPKLKDARKAGTKDSIKCKLILTEGDSAKSFALAGMSAIEKSSDHIGVFPLKGKPLNVREASVKALEKNEEIVNIKKILGLKQKHVYTSLNELRYGGIVVLADQDYDGYHIKGLIINFIHYFWPSLIKLGFLYTIVTPIVTITKKAGRSTQKKDFYNLNDFEKWKEENDITPYTIKYKKGLGTSNRKEAQEAFENFDTKLIKIEEDDNDSETFESMSISFDKKRADDRKVLLSNYNKDLVLDYNDRSVTVSDVTKKELIHHSFYNTTRAVPSICDGLKTSQRKIVYCTFMKKLFTKEVKVAQLSAAVSETTAYHHGEKSLNDAIVRMARTFVGSNNINLLYPSGQFGTRVMGGEDHASERYIYTRFETITPFIFNKLDEPILNYLDDDGARIEPEHFIPVIPMILVNGTQGIGTGYSTTVLSYNPLDIVNNIYNLMDGKEMTEMMPWYRNFKGDILRDGVTYEFRGKYNKISNNMIEITELPIGTWTENYKNNLETMEANKDISIVDDGCLDINIYYKIKIKKKKLLDLLDANSPDFYKAMKLRTTKKITNMHLRDVNGITKKYHDVNDIVKEFYDIRVDYYAERKEYLLAKYKRELNIYKWKVKFITDVITGKILVFKNKKSLKKQQVIDQLVKLKYPELAITGTVKSYDYTNMNIYSLTQEKIVELKKKFEVILALVNELKNKTELDLWDEDLIIFEREYKKWFEQSQDDELKKPKKTRKKK
jgi:DNA topoisomerase-2